MSPRRRPRVRAFTLVELMVAVVVGLIAISTIYLLANGATRHFQEQQRISTTQTALRLAMEQLRTDIERAGFGGTPNSLREVSCAAAPTQIQAVEFLDNIDSGLLPFASTNGVEADGLRLVGNYATSGAYLAIGTNTAGNSVRLQTAWQSFRRDFGVLGASGADAFDPGTFERVFAPNRRLHVETEHGFHFFPEIRGTAASTQDVQLMSSLPIMTACLPGLADNALVSPLTRIEYRVVDPADGTNGLTALVSPNAGADALGLSAPVLIRREVDFETGTPIPGTTRVVLEYVADFHLEFVVNTAAPGIAPVLSFPPLDGAAAQAVMERSAGARPQTVRSIIVSLSARSPDIDPRFPFVAGRADRTQPLSRYAVRSTDADAPAARVRTITTEVFLPNVVSRNLP